MDQQHSWWHRQTLAETFQRIQSAPEYPWVAIGDFLDEWRRSNAEERGQLIQEEMAGWDDAIQLIQWAAFCAAMVEWLCTQEHITVPQWVYNQHFTLRVPWYLYPGELLKDWQETTTPAPFRARNIFGGDRMLNRA